MSGEEAINRLVELEDRLYHYTYDRYGRPSDIHSLEHRYLLKEITKVFIKCDDYHVKMTILYNYPLAVDTVGIRREYLKRWFATTISECRNREVHVYPDEVY